MAILSYALFRLYCQSLLFEAAQQFSPLIVQ